MLQAIPDSSYLSGPLIVGHATGIPQNVGEHTAPIPNHIASDVKHVQFGKKPNIFLRRIVVAGVFIGVDRTLSCPPSGGDGRASLALLAQVE